MASCPHLFPVVISSGEPAPSGSASSSPAASTRWQARVRGWRRRGRPPVMVRWSRIPPACSHFPVASATGSSRRRVCHSSRVVSPPRATPTAPPPSAAGPRLALVNNHEISGERALPCACSAGADVRPRRGRRHHHHRGRAPTATRVREYVSLAGTRQQLRRRHDAVEHLADLRGDRDVAPGVRTEGPRLRVRGRSVRPGRQPGPGSAEVPRAVRPRGGRRRSRTPSPSTRPRTPAARTACTTAGLRRTGSAAARARCVRWPGRPGRRHRRPAAGDELLRPWPAHPRPVGGDPARARRTRLPGWTCRTGTPPRRRSATSSPTTRSPAAASSRAPGGATAAPTSSPASRVRPTAAPTSTTARCGSTTHDQQTVTLKTIFGVNPDPSKDTDYDGPDNITVSPYGGVILAEDGEGDVSTWSASPSRATRTRWPATISTAASSPARPSARTGASCSPTSRRPGYVFAITGPWGRPHRTTE